MNVLRAQNAGITKPLSAVARPICTILGVLVLFSSVAAASPVITGFLVNGVASNTGPIGATLTIQGSGFGATQGFSTATLNGIAVAGNGVRPTSWSDTSIVAPIPTTATSGPVVVKVSGVSSNAVNFNIGALISSISAATAPVGTTITLTGAGFGTAGGTVTFGGATATISSWTASSIQAQVPNAANTGSVTVSVGGQASNGVAFTPMPVTTGISPTSGVSGASVTITGTGFGSSHGSVTFNSTPATIMTWGVNSITVLVPSNGTGGANNAVVTVNGVSSTPVGFTVIPQITSVVPGSGVGGSSVTISGSNFGLSQGTSAVAFNGISATATSWSVNTITAMVPLQATSGNIVVTVGGQPSNGIPFTLIPHISSVTPGSGPVGAPVTIAGSGFGSSQGTSTVTFSGIAASPTIWTVNSITVTVPNGLAAGANNMVVTVGGNASNSVTFTVVPNITNVAPPSGGIGTSVTITGTSFGATQGPSTLTIGGVSPTITSWSDAKIVATVPNTLVAGSVNIVVTVNGQTSSNAIFNVTPVISSLAPVSGRFGTAVTIKGTSFGAAQGASTVAFNGTLGSPTSWNDTTIVVPVPSGSSTGNVVVTVNNQPSNGINFTVTSPSISNINPAQGAAGDTVTITGAGFGAVNPGIFTINAAGLDFAYTAVAFKNIPAQIVSWSDKSIKVTVPCGGVDGNVVVNLPDAGGAFPGGFLNQPPALNSSNGVPFATQLQNAGIRGSQFVIQNGPANNRAQIVFLGDGYTQRDLDSGKYANDVQNSVNALFLERPFSDYQLYFNVARVDVASAQCGATHNETTPPGWAPFNPVSNAVVQNFFGSAYKGSCSNPQAPSQFPTRFLCTNDPHDASVLAAINGIPALNNGGNPRGIVVLVNDAEYGGTTIFDGAAKSFNGHMLSLGQDQHFEITEVVKHELGHHFGQLGDEYLGGGCNLGQANISATNSPTPWDIWLPPNPPAPGNPVGAFAGACIAQWFRPTQASKMQFLGQPFDDVNDEDLVFKTYQAMLFPDGQSQPQGNPTLVEGTAVAFEPKVPNPNSADMQYTWTIDGNQQNASGKGPNSRVFNLDTTPLAAGVYNVQVQLQDQTALVRNPIDQQSMQGTVNWSLTVTCNASTTVTDYDVIFDIASVPPIECDDTHEVTDTFDCQGNLISSIDVIINEDCQECGLAGSELVDGPQYTNDLGQTCVDRFLENDYQCLDGFGVSTLQFEETVCFTILPPPPGGGGEGGGDNCIDSFDDDPECFGDLEAKNLPMPGLPGHRSSPVYYALSLGPLALAAFYVQRRQRRRKTKGSLAL
ncbi:MAG: IPT/TIG domain-containing protein [Candidatus Angelobacter sp.]